MANERDPMCGAVDQAAFDTVISDNLSPAGVAAIVAVLRAGDAYRPSTAAGQRAMREVAWLAETLLEMIGVETYNRHMNDLGL